MRNIIILTLFFLVTTNSFSQQTSTQPSLSQTDYLQNSKNQKKIGRVLLISSAALITTAILIPRGKLLRTYNCVPGYFFNVCERDYGNDGIKNTIGIAGVLSAIGSIPLFIASGINRRKAVSLSYKTENIYPLYGQNLVLTSFPALHIKIDL